MNNYSTKSITSVQAVILHFGDKKHLDKFISNANRVLHRISDTSLFCLCTVRGIKIAELYFNATVEIVEEN